jgi:hypothetical protein
VDRATAKELKERGGIALGGRLDRRLKHFSKNQEPTTPQTAYGRRPTQDRINATAARNQDLVSGESLARREHLQSIKAEGGTPRSYHRQWPEYSEIFGKEASVSKAETRRAALVAEQRMMGRGPAIMGSYPTKEANLDPVTEQRAKHIDDLGLAVLGTPAALSLAQHGLNHVGGRTGAVARGAAALANRLRPVSNVLSHGGPVGYATELGGLALVSPTVSEAIAKKIPTKLAPTCSDLCASPQLLQTWRRR